MRPHFTSRIKTPLGHFNFYFNRIFTVNGVCFHVSVTDNLRKVHMFVMTEVNEIWSILNHDKFPQWIIRLEAELSDVIIKYTQTKEN